MKRGEIDSYPRVECSGRNDVKNGAGLIVGLERGFAGEDLADSLVAKILPRERRHVRLPADQLFPARPVGRPRGLAIQVRALLLVQLLLLFFRQRFVCLGHPAVPLQEGSLFSLASLIFFVASLISISLHGSERGFYFFPGKGKCVPGQPSCGFSITQGALASTSERGAVGRMRIWQLIVQNIN